VSTFGARLADGLAAVGHPAATAAAHRLPAMDGWTAGVDGVASRPRTHRGAAAGRFFGTAVGAAPPAGRPRVRFVVAEVEGATAAAAANGVVDGSGDGGGGGGGGGSRRATTVVALPLTHALEPRPFGGSAAVPRTRAGTCRGADAHGQTGPLRR